MVAQPVSFDAECLRGHPTPQWDGRMRARCGVVDGFVAHVTHLLVVVCEAEGRRRQMVETFACVVEPVLSEGAELAEVAVLAGRKGGDRAALGAPVVAFSRLR